MGHVPSRWLVLCLLTSFIAAAFADFGSLSRGVSAVGGCQNTGGGRWFMADDQGRVCQRAEFDYTTGCCEHGAQQFQCDSCDPDDSCCSSYEHCVSCCMSPAQEPEEHMTKIPRGFGKEETGYWDSPFEYCRAVCRTTSRSTQHENAFISDRRFCFAGNGRPHTPTPRVPPLSKGVTAVVGPPGSNCDAVCKERNQECNVDHFAALNDCNALRSVFMCEAGCGPSEFNKREFPGYVVEEAAKQDWPAFCFYYFDRRKAVAGLVQQYNCSASSEHVQRLCPCESAPGLTSQGGQLDALSKQQQQIKGKQGSIGDGSGGSGSNGNGNLAAGNSISGDDDRNDNDSQQFELDALDNDRGDDQRR